MIAFVDPITARAALHLPPAAPLTPEQIDAAHRAQVWTYHPSRYADRDERAAAVAWVQALDAARATLIAEPAGPTGATLTTSEPVAPTSTTTGWTAPSGGAHWAPVGGASGAPTDWAAAVAAGAPAGAIPAAAGPSAAGPFGPPSQPRKRGLSTGWIVGIAAGSVLLVALVVGIGFGAVALGERIATLAESSEETGVDDESVEHYSARATMFSFPAALEYYFDGRYSDECAADLELGCWEAAVIPEQSCAIMTVTYGFAATEDQLEPDLVESDRFYDVEAGEVVPIVFGNDEYEYGWPIDVTCHDQTAT